MAIQGDDYKGGLLFAKLDNAKRMQDFLAAARWLKARSDCIGKIGATGFCYGGGVANSLAVLMGEDLKAAAPFYGAASKPEDVPKIKAAILIHHGALDKALAAAYPAQAAELEKNHIRYEGHIYPNAVHGFFNDATPERYDGSRPSRRGRAQSNGSTSMFATRRCPIRRLWQEAGFVLQDPSCVMFGWQ